MPLIAASQARDEPQALTGRQLHVLMAIAAADLVEADRLAEFLASYIDPGVDIWFQPVSVTALRRALHTVLDPYEPTKRARLLTSLAEHTTRELIRWAPRTTAFDPVCLTRLAKDDDHRVRSSVAANPNIHTDLLIDLANDEHRAVRASVARHPKTPTATLIHLAGDKEWHVRWGVAENPKTPTATVIHLAGDRSGDVRSSAAKHPKTPPAILIRLAGDSHRPVREAVARNTKTPPAILIRLAGEQEARVRWAVSENPNAPAATLIHLAGDEEWHVRWGVAENPNTPADTLIHLAGDEDETVRAAAAKNLESRRAGIAERRHESKPATPPDAGSTRSARTITDPDHRYEIALRGDRPVEDRMVVAGAVERIAQAVDAIGQGARPKASSVRDADSLPSLDDLPYPTAPGAQARLDLAAEQHGVPVHVLATGREQRRNGRVMDNCTLADSYVSACQAGTTIVAAFKHDDQPYNIAWEYDSGTWQRRDLSGKGNKRAPEAVAALANQLTGMLAGLEPGRPIAITTQDAIDAIDALVIEPTADLARTEPSQFAIP